MSCIFCLQCLFLAACRYSQLSWVTELGYTLPRRPQISLWKILIYYSHVIVSVSTETSSQLLRVHSTALAPLGSLVDCVWNVMAHSQKPNFVFRRNGRAHLNRRGRQFSRLLAAEVCASAVAMLDTPCSEVVWRVLATHSIPQFPLHFPSRASPCAITFQLESNYMSTCTDINAPKFSSYLTESTVCLGF